MTDDRDKREGQAGTRAKNPKQDTPKDSRRDRLKQALRENLKRRKSQARGRSDIAVTPSNHDDAPPHDGNGKKPGE